MMPTDEELKIFWTKVDKTDSCWIWKPVKGKDRYGTFRIDGTLSNLYCHRITYQLYKGNIPNHLEIDHLCNNKSCCNPDHLEAVTHQINIKRAFERGRVPGYSRRTHCKNGHEFTQENTTFAKGSRKGRICRECHRLLNKLYWRRKRMEV